MGYYVFDPWLLNMDGAANGICRIQDHASDLLVLHIASAINIDKLVHIECNDHGNMAEICAS